MAREIWNRNSGLPARTWFQISSSLEFPNLNIDGVPNIRISKPQYWGSQTSILSFIAILGFPNLNIEKFSILGFQTSILRNFSILGFPNLNIGKILNIGVSKSQYWEFLNIGVSKPQYWEFSQYWGFQTSLLGIY